MFGWGSNSITYALADGRALLYRYEYFHIMFVLRIVGGERWFLISDSRSQDRQVTFEEAAQLLPNRRPRLNILSRYGLLFFIGFVILLNFFLE